MSFRRSIPILLFAAFALDAVGALCVASMVGCGPDARPKWSAFGADALGCARPGLASVIDAGLGDLQAMAGGGARADWKSVGTDLGLKFGIPMALCIAEAGFKRFAGGSASLPADAPPSAQAAVWLHENRDEWAR